MAQFKFTGKRVQQEYGVFTVEAKDFREALDKINWGQCEFEGQANRGPQVSAMELGLYLFDENTTVEEKK